MDDQSTNPMPAPDSGQPPSPPSPSPQGGAAARMAVVAALVVVVAGGTYWLSGQMGQSEQTGQTSETSTETVMGETSLPTDDTAAEQNKQKAAEIVAKVREHILIDEDIKPTVATIIDVTRLQEQNDFYLIAKNGDYLVITPKKAILYDEAADLVLDVATVRLERDGQVVEAVQQTSEQ